MGPSAIRPYRPSDFVDLCRVHDAARRCELAHADLADAFLPLSIAAGREGLFDCSVCVAEQDGAVSGFIAYSSSEIAWLYVDPAKQRRGIGSRLIRHALERCEAPVLVEVLAGNTPALQLYQSLGFVIACTRKGVMPGNEAFAVEGVVLRRAQAGPEEPG